MLPGFLCVGAAKAGSTTIFDVLSQHEQIFFPSVKELHFFDNDDLFAKGVNWYAEQFKTARPGQIAGEITPAYMSYATVPERIHAILGGDIKLIFSLREPVARAYSEFLHNRRRGFFDAEFQDAIQWEFERSELTPWQRRTFSFISRGYYFRQISRYLALFPQKNMFFIVMEEDFGNRSQDTFAALLKFLELDSRQLKFDKQSNVGYDPRYMAVQRMLFNDNPIRKWAQQLVRSKQLRRNIRRILMAVNAKRSPPPALAGNDRQRLQERYYAREIFALEELLGRDLSIWRKFSDVGASE